MSSSSRTPYKKDASLSPTKKKNRGIYRDWTKEPYKLALAKAVQAATKGLDPQEVAGYIYIPLTTLHRAMAKIAQHKEELMEERGEDFVYLSKFERKHVHVTNEQASLTLEDDRDREFLQKLITLCDKNKNGMSRIECIGMLMAITSTHKRKAELHFDHLQRYKHLPELKGNGSIQTEQKTTTKRTQVMTKKLFCWHGTVDAALIELHRLNLVNPAWAENVLKCLIDYFWGNFDKSNMSASEGTVKIIGAADVKRHEKNMDDNRESVTIIHAGVAGGAGGPRICLAKGKRLESKSLRNFDKNYKYPPFSRVVMTPSAYVTDEVWRELAENFCKGIGAMPVVQKYPDLWMVFTTDGFRSHLDPTSLEVFARYKILLVKEWRDSSHVCQPYDQFVAKEDKRHLWSLLTGYRLNAPMIGQAQFELILIANTALNKV